MKKNPARQDLEGNHIRMPEQHAPAGFDRWGDVPSCADAAPPFVREAKPKWPPVNASAPLTIQTELTHRKDVRSASHHRYNGDALENVEEKPGRRFVRELLSWLRYIAIAVILSLLLITFVIQKNQVQGRSMQPTLQPGDILWVQKISRLWGGIGRGNIITIHADLIGTIQDTHGEDWVKRVIGLPGEHVRIQGGEVYVNERKLDEPYLADGVRTQCETANADVLLGENQYYVLGDNRMNSTDSRIFGPVPARAIAGSVWFRSSPLDRFGSVQKKMPSFHEQAEAAG